MNSSYLSGATLVFDLDGTLVDTAPDLLRSVNHVLEKIGCDPVDGAQIRPAISFGARRIITEGLSANGKSLDKDEIDDLFARFLDFYAANVAVESKPYADVTGVLGRAKEAGACLGVCTNKREDLSLMVLKELALHDYFSAIVGRDTLNVCKPHPLHLTETIARAGGKTDNAVMIGDSPTDVKTARAAGIPVIAVSFGYSDVPPRELGADFVIDDYGELLDVLPAVLSR